MSVDIIFVSRQSRKLKDVIKYETFKKIVCRVINQDIKRNLCFEITKKNI